MIIDDSTPANFCAKVCSCFACFAEPSPLIPTASTCESDASTYPITVRKLASARRYTLRVRSAQRDIVISMPARGSLSTAAAFAEKHADWIVTRITQLVGGGQLRRWRFGAISGHDPSNRAPAGALAAWSRSRTRPVPVLVVAGEAPHLPRRMTDWFRRQALKELTAAVERHCESANAKYASVSIKDTASRWGSCSSSGALSFSWRLIMAPPFVLDYLAAHEVAHLKEMNHSQRFWRLCEKLCPRTDDAKAWLKNHGAGLHRYG